MTSWKPKWQRCSDVWRYNKMGKCSIVPPLSLFSTFPPGLRWTATYTRFMKVQRCGYSTFHEKRWASSQHTYLSVQRELCTSTTDIDFIQWSFQSFLATYLTYGPSAEVDIDIMKSRQPLVKLQSNTRMHSAWGPYTANCSTTNTILVGTLIEGGRQSIWQRIISFGLRSDPWRYRESLVMHCHW